MYFRYLEGEEKCISATWRVTRQCFYAAWLTTNPLPARYPVPRHTPTISNKILPKNIFPDVLVP